MALVRCFLAPLTGLEPVHTAPEADALSAELQGLGRVRLPRPQDPPAAAWWPSAALSGSRGKARGQGPLEVPGPPTVPDAYDPQSPDRRSNEVQEER